MTDRELAYCGTAIFFGVVTLVVLVVSLAFPRTETVYRDQTRTHGLTYQAKLHDITTNGVTTMECEAWSDGPLNFETGAKPGDVVLSICKATKYDASMETLIG